MYIRYLTPHTTIAALFQPIMSEIEMIITQPSSTKPLCLKVTGNTDSGKSNFIEFELSKFLKKADLIQIHPTKGIPSVFLTSTTSLKNLYTKLLNEQLVFPSNSRKVADLEDQLGTVIKNANPRIGALVIDEFNQVRHASENDKELMYKMLGNVPRRSQRPMIVFGRPTMDTLFEDFTNKRETKDLATRFISIKMPSLSLTNDIRTFETSDNGLVFTTDSEIVASLITNLTERALSWAEKNDIPLDIAISPSVDTEEFEEILYLLVKEANGKLGTVVRIWDNAVNKVVRNHEELLTIEDIIWSIEYFHQSGVLKDEERKYTVKINPNWYNDLIKFLNARTIHEEMMKRLRSEFKLNNVIDGRILFDLLYILDKLQLFKGSTSTRISNFVNLIDLHNKSMGKKLTQATMKSFKRKLIKDGYIKREAFPDLAGTRNQNTEYFIERRRNSLEERNKILQKWIQTLSEFNIDDLDKILNSKKSIGLKKKKHNEITSDIK